MTAPAARRATRTRGARLPGPVRDAVVCPARGCRASTARSRAAPGSTTAPRPLRYPRRRVTCAPPSTPGTATGSAASNTPSRSARSPRSSRSPTAPPTPRAPTWHRTGLRPAPSVAGRSHLPAAVPNHPGCSRSPSRRSASRLLLTRSGASSARPGVSRAAQPPATSRSFGRVTRRRSDRRGRTSRTARAPSRRDPACGPPCNRHPSSPDASTSRRRSASRASRSRQAAS